MSDDPDFEYLIVDSTIVQADQHAAGTKKGGLKIRRCRSRGGLSTKIHMAVRGLGCPVRFTLTAGQKGDAPQAVALLEGLPAEVVMADTAYDADHLREAIAAKGAIAVIPNNPSRALNIPGRHLYAQRHLVECCFSKVNNSAASQPASKRPPEITAPSSLSRLSSYGCDKCPHDLGRVFS